MTITIEQLKAALIQAGWASTINGSKTGRGLFSELTECMEIESLLPDLLSALHAQLTDREQAPQDEADKWGEWNGGNVQ